MAIIIGISQGTQPIVSFNYGAKKYKRCRKTYLLAAKVVLIISVVFFTIFQLCPDMIISIFGKGSREYYDFSRKCFRIFLFMTSLFHTHHFLSMYFLLLCNKLPKLTSLKTTHLLSQHLWTRSPAWFSWTLFQVLKGYDQRIRQAAFPSGYWGKNMIPSLFRLGYYAFAHSTILTISFVIMRKLFYILACV